MGKIITDFSSVTTVGLDLAKPVFQVHCVDASGRVVVAKSVRRNKLLEFFASLPFLPRRARGMRLGASLGAGTRQTRA